MTETINNKRKLPSVLSFLKSVDVTDCVIDGVKIIEKGTRTLQAQEGGKKEGNKSSGDGVTALIVQEFCKALGDEVKFSFHMRVFPFNKEKLFQISLESKDNKDKDSNIEFMKRFEEIIDYIKNTDKNELLRKNADYIAFNILNGRWLWRNRDLSDNITVRVFEEDEKEPLVEVNDVQYITKDIILDENNEIDYEKTGMSRNKLKVLSDKILEMMVDEGEDGRNLYIEAVLEVVEGQNMFPSQLFNPIEETIGESPVSRRFYKTITKDDENIPAISSEKLWNAIRTYDVWYNNYSVIKEPISIEFLGTNIKYQTSFRKSDEYFSTILFDATIGNKNFKDLSEEKCLFFTACLIRGGALTITKDKKKDKK